MKKHYLATQIPVLLLFLLFTISCNAQGGTSVSKADVARATRPAKMIKTQGDNKYNTVGQSIEDQAGNLWFGTSAEGIYRYDGKIFTNFTEKDGLMSNRISGIAADKNGDIWISTPEGISCYDGKKFRNIPVSVINGSYTYGAIGNKAAKAPMEIWSIFQDKKGTIWIGTNNDGVYCYDGKVFTHFLHQDKVENKDGLQLNAVNTILEDKAGNIWFSTWFEGLCRYDGKAVIHFTPNDEVWFSRIFEDKAGNIWAGRRGKGVCRFDGKSFTNVLQKGLFDECCVLCITQDESGNMWFGTEAANIAMRDNMGGLWSYNGQSFKNFTAEEGLGNYSVFSVLGDRKGNIWAGTRNTSLYRYDGKVIRSFSE
ncbi:hypothetical protein DBR32_14670 [Taibaiella sp. KBW10]|uniref:ligand-binding sensor domain-containing protein n=1 Tax=Taibaiella sp. KBW10 TaxID=2153357 RepID=UPI000F5ADB11|nr:two-component regulator propeller domain-containing protein [Taibaiella sp. KBW10]RQO29824.1 hypothetical protein DBR32_14670 [Taibaiella sp. KBW10]